MDHPQIIIIYYYNTSSFLFTQITLTYCSCLSVLIYLFLITLSIIPAIDIYPLVLANLFLIISVFPLVFEIFPHCIL